MSGIGADTIPIPFGRIISRTKEAARKILAAHGYRIAGITMDLSDWQRSDAYARCRDKKNSTGLAALESAYLQAVPEAIGRSRGMSRAVYGSDIPYVLLTHLSPFNARIFGRVLGISVKKDSDSRRCRWRSPIRLMRATPTLRSRPRAEPRGTRRRARFQHDGPHRPDRQAQRSLPLTANRPTRSHGAATAFVQRFSVHRCAACSSIWRTLAGSTARPPSRIG